MNRRQFLLSSAILVAGCDHTIHTGSNRIESNVSIVDTHQHLWNLRQFDLPWLQPGGELTRDLIKQFISLANEE